MLLKIDTLVYITAGKISVPGKIILIWESYQVKFSCLCCPLFCKQSYNDILILCYLCNFLHLTSSTGFKDFLTLSNALVGNWAIDLSKSHRRPCFSKCDLWVSLDKRFISIQSMRRVPGGGLQRRTHLQYAMRSFIDFTKPRKSANYS